MKKFTKFLLACSFLPTLAWAVPVLAYNDKTTHPALTDEIVDFYNLLHPDNTLSAEEKEWLISGSVLEDEWPRWINHFYDPVRKIGWNGEGVSGISPAAVKLIASISVTSEEPLASSVWLNSSEAQKKYSRYGGDRSWQTGLVNYARGNQEEGFKILGHALHLLEDASVPDHTRNDTHAHLEVFGDDGSPFEDYLSRWDRENISSLRIPNNLIVSGMHPPALSSPEEFVYKLAEYSNNYFFSKDTINSNVYKNPKIVKEDESTAFGLDENNNIFPILRVKFSKEGDLIFNKEYSITKYRSDILDSYFSRLSNKAVLYGAGMIDLFLRQAEEEKIKQEFQSNVIGYDFSFLSAPSFSLAGELNRVKNSILSLVASAAGFVNSIGSKINNLISAEDSEVEVVEQEEISEKEEVTIEEAEVKVLEEEDNLTVEAEKVEDSFEKEIIKTELAVLEKNEILKINTKETTKSTGESGSASPRAQLDYRVRFTEFFYDADGSDENKEWIEVYNFGSDNIPLGDLILLEDGTKHGIKPFSGGDSLNVGGFLIIADNPETFVSNNPSFSGLLGDSSFSLNNSSETLVLIALGEEEDSQTYSSSTGAAGDGNSLQRKSNGVWIAKKPTPGGVVDESINRPPEIVWSFPESVLVGEKADFAADSSSDLDGDLLIYSWDFGDGESASVATVQHTYSESGIYEINLSVSDSKGGVSYASGTIAVGSAGGEAAKHLVISEIQVAGLDSGDEFVEIYNPTDSTVSLNNWSIQYISGSAEEISPIKKNFVSTSTVPAKGFFLIAKGLSGSNEDGYRGVSDLTHRSFSLSGASSGGIVILVSTTTPISSFSDPSIIDLVFYGHPILRSSDLPVPEDYQSLERNSFAGDSCFPAINDYEFSGNSCDSDSSSDFSLRALSKPQTSLNLPEPRIPPAKPIAGLAGFANYQKNQLITHLNWGVPAGQFAYYEIYKDGILFATTTENNLDINISEVGKENIFKVRTMDSEGLGSEYIEEKEAASSFITKLDFFWDNDKNSLILRGFYDGEYLVPQINRATNRPTWSAPVFFLNKEPIYSESINIYDGQINSPTEVGFEALRFNLKRCNGADIVANGITFPDAGSVCPGFGADSGDTNPNSDEDKHFEFSFEPIPELENLNSTDFLTVAFYELFSASTYGKYMPLTAIDKTHYYFQETRPVSASPEMLGGLSGLLSETEQKVSFSFNRAKDSDSTDSVLKYEYRYSSSTLEESDEWAEFIPLWNENIGKLIIPISWKQNINIEIRSKDDRGNVSSPLFMNWQYPNFSVVLEQNNKIFWSPSFGYPSDIWRPSADKAIFQSFQISNSNSFNRVSLRIKNTPTGNYYGGDLRLTVLRGNTTPEFSEVLGEATLENYSNEEREITFSFSSPINLQADTKYWLVLDVAAAGRTDNALQIAVAGDNPYPDGEAGEGYFKGPLADCGCSLNQTFPDQDWYFQLYTVP